MYLFVAQMTSHHTLRDHMAKETTNIVFYYDWDVYAWKRLYWAKLGPFWSKFSYFKAILT